MQPIDFKDRKVILGAPKDWDEARDGTCGGLPVTHDGQAFVSYWRPTWTEKLALLAKGVIELRVVGTGHPPVSVAVVDEPE
jgi:hypothetical protein